MPAEITLTSKRPAPPQADFAFEIDFKRGEGSPSRVFSAINDFIRECERLDAELTNAIDANIESRPYRPWRAGHRLSGRHGIRHPVHAAL
jgi:hypothetical protein